MTGAAGSAASGSSEDPRRSRFPLGIAGAGQLARMTIEAASAMGIPVAVLAERDDDAATSLASSVLLGSAASPTDLARLAGSCDVVTFDHEQVDLDALARLQGEGRAVRPGPDTLRIAVDKARMRQMLSSAGIPVPAFAVVGGDGPDGRLAAVEAFAERHGWPVVLKAARGGYDGKGVWPVDGPHDAVAVCRDATAQGTGLVVEEMVAITSELAVLVARRTGGEVVVWDPVETRQVDGVCREVLAPAFLDQALAEEAVGLARRVADQTGVVGVMAVELFRSDRTLLVNEVAARPHNSGHWTIEGATTSQFDNHLRAVLDLPLGDTRRRDAHVASVNVFGDAGGSDPAGGLARALAVPGAHVHLYGKSPRPRRKLGHVTVCGTDPEDVRSRAWAAARALGTREPADLGVAVPDPAAGP